MHADFELNGCHWIFKTKEDTSLFCSTKNDGMRSCNGREAIHEAGVRLGGEEEGWRKGVAAARTRSGRLMMGNIGRPRVNYHDR